MYYGEHSGLQALVTGVEQKQILRSGTPFFISREWNNGLKADFYPSLPCVLRGALEPTGPWSGTINISQRSGTLFLYFSREWNNGLKANFYPSVPRVLREALWPTVPYHGSGTKINSHRSGTHTL